LAAASLTGLVGLLATGTLENRSTNAEFAEYVYIRKTLNDAPRPLTLVDTGLQEPSSALPARMAERLGVLVTRSDTVSRGPMIFFAGPSCHAHGMPALFWAMLGPRAPGPEDVERFLLAAHDPLHGFGTSLVPRPQGPRDACAKLIDRATPWGKE